MDGRELCIFNKTHKNNINSKLTYGIFASHCALFSVIFASIIAWHVRMGHSKIGSRVGSTGRVDFWKERAWAIAAFIAKKSLFKNA